MREVSVSGQTYSAHKWHSYPRPWKVAACSIRSQERCGEKDRGIAFIDAFLQIDRRIYAKEPDPELAFLRHLAVDHVMVIHQIIDIQEIAQRKVKIQHRFLLRKFPRFSKNSSIWEASRIRWKVNVPTLSRIW